MNQFLKIAAVFAIFIVIFASGAVIGGVVMVHVARGRFERFEHQRQERQDREERKMREADQQQFGQMIGALRQQLQQLQMQRQQQRQLPAPQQFGPQLMQRFIKQIGPTPEQRDKIRPMVNQAAEDLRRLRRDTTHNSEMILEHLQDQIAGLLTPEQRDRFNDMIQRWRDAFQRYNLEQQQRQAQQRLLEQQQRWQQQYKAPPPQASPPAPAQPSPPSPPQQPGPVGH